MKIIIASMIVIPLALLLVVANAFAKDSKLKETQLSDQERILQYTAAMLKNMHPISAKDVYDIVQSKDAGYMLVSLQSAEEYTAGHVPGSVRIPVDLSKPFGAAIKLPKDKTIILVSSNGQEACKMAVFLRQFGYKANPMMMGMNAYNKAYAGTGAYAGDVSGEISLQNVPFSPQPALSTYSNLSEHALIGERTLEYARKKLPFEISTTDFINLTAKEDVVIISMQKPEDYAAGHIPGAINIPGPRFIAGDKRLLNLPRDKKIIVTCYIGHYSSMGTMILNQLGYEAYSLVWGLAGWNIKPLGEGMTKGAIKGAGFKVESTQ